MVWIDKALERYIKGCFPEREVYAYCRKFSRQSSRFLQVATVLTDDMDIHYEYYDDSVELHLEGKYQSNDYRYFAKELRIKSFGHPELKWLSWDGHAQCRCRISSAVNEWGDLTDVFTEMMKIFDPIIEGILRSRPKPVFTAPFQGDTTLVDEVAMEEKKKDPVNLTTASLGKLFGNALVIPDYQRSYCWEDKQVKALWESVKEIPTNGKYHLGTIILQKTSDNRYAVIDGQQRLVTLSLLVRELKYQGPIPLLKQKFLSKDSQKHIANTRWIVSHLAEKVYDETLCSRIINNLIFTVLILEESRLDLAYTFFSNENAKGVPLSDYDLLKAHHLRYIFIERQAEYQAERWNNIIENDYVLLDKTLARHLYRLRKWMRKRDFDPDEKYCVKEEFSAALIIPEIPPFGENFSFYEKIQGGSHFFAYTEHFVNRYRSFLSTGPVRMLKEYLGTESHWRYADIIETLLFGYYLKFGEQYLPEALFCIAGNIAQHRYSAARALSYKIREFAKNSEIIMMIDQASSPTFFLAECSAAIRIFGRDLDEQGIALRFYQHFQELFAEMLPQFSDPTIIKKCENEYM